MPIFLGSWKLLFEMSLMSLCRDNGPIKKLMLHLPVQAYPRSTGQPYQAADYKREEVVESAQPGLV